MRVCYRCKQEKPLLEFRKNSRGRDGLHAWCTPCFKKYESDRYKNGDKARKDANKHKVRDFNRDFVWKYLETNHCVDCGESDPVVLDFDHQGNKLSNISEMYLGNHQKLVQEISKCEVRCSNCHRRRTAKQLGLWKATGR